MTYEGDLTVAHALVDQLSEVVRVLVNRRERVVRPAHKSDRRLYGVSERVGHFVLQYELRSRRFIYTQMLFLKSPHYFTWLRLQPAAHKAVERTQVSGHQAMQEQHYIGTLSRW